MKIRVRLWNVTLFGNSLCAYDKMRSYWSDVGPKYKDSVLRRGQDTETLTEDDHGKMEAVVGRVQPQAKESPGTSEGGKRREGATAGASGGRAAPPAA